MITNPPANHIIMYATGAGSVASDGGTGRNGLFTGHLINNLRQPIEINEIFRRTMVDVANASNNEQRPALYTDFGQVAYFGSVPANAQTLYSQTTNGRILAQDEPVSNNPLAQELPPIKLTTTLYYGNKIHPTKILEAEKEGLDSLKFRIAMGEDPQKISPYLLQNIFDEQSKQKNRAVAAWSGYLIGAGLMVSSLIPVFSFISLDTNTQNEYKTKSVFNNPYFQAFGIMAGSGSAIYGLGMYYGYKHDKGMYEIASLRAQFSYLQLSLKGSY